MLRRPPALRQTIARLVVACVAAMQLAVAPAVAFADAQDAASASQIAATGHVEGEGGIPHRALHLDGCVLCQFLSVPGLAAAGGPPMDGLATRLGAMSAVVSPAPSAATHGEPPARAPPAPA